MTYPIEHNKPDVCHYCGKQYHPMGVWTKGRNKRWVCHVEFIYNDKGQLEAVKRYKTCENIASGEGFRFNRKLTPTR